MARWLFRSIHFSSEALFDASGLTIASAGPRRLGRGRIYQVRLRILNRPPRELENETGADQGEPNKCKQAERRRLNPATAFSGTRMTGDESRKLKSGDRIFWRDDLKNQGTVRGTSWSGVTIDWEDGESTSVSHNDMAQVSRAPS
jgi:hypothetical protein